MSKVRRAAAGTRKERPPVFGSTLSLGIVSRITPSMAELVGPLVDARVVLDPAVAPVLLAPVVVSVDEPVVLVVPVVVPVVPVVPVVLVPVVVPVVVAPVLVAVVLVVLVVPVVVPAVVLVVLVVLVVPVVVLVVAVLVPVWCRRRRSSSCSWCRWATQRAHRGSWRFRCRPLCR
jgi:hypothetical protein